VSTATELPVYDENDLTLSQVIDLAEGRALLRSRYYDPNNPDVEDTFDMTLTESERRAFDSARERGWLEADSAKGWVDYNPYRLWDLYCGVTGAERPLVVLATDPRRVARDRLAHQVTIELGHTGLKLTAAAKRRLDGYLDPFINRRHRFSNWGFTTLQFHVRDSKLDEFRDFMPALVDMIQELAVDRE
jgi:hypothetical protein